MRVSTSFFSKTTRISYSCRQKLKMLSVFLLVLFSTATAISSDVRKMAVLRAASDADADAIALGGEEGKAAASPPYALQPLVPLLRAACGDLESARWLMAARRALWCECCCPPSPSPSRHPLLVRPPPPTHTTITPTFSVGASVKLQEAAIEADDQMHANMLDPETEHRGSRLNLIQPKVCRTAPKSSLWPGLGTALPQFSPPAQGLAVSNERYLLNAVQTVLHVRHA